MPPLTRRQTLFWLDEQLFPGAPYHHHALTIRLEGALDRVRLQRALEQTERDVDQLRLVIESDDGTPTQRVRPDGGLVLEDVDLRTAPDSFDAWLALETVRPFDMGRALHRASLVRLGDEAHVFCLFVHHIASDGASIALIVRHLGARYAGSPVAPHPSFLDYVDAERAYLDTKKAAKDAAYWKAKLGSGTPPLAFYGRPRTSLSVESTRLWVDGGPARRQRLEALLPHDPVHLMHPSISRLVAMATVLFAFVHRTTGNETLAIGTPVPNRTARFVDTCGLLMEQVFLVVRIDEGETFATLAEKVRREVLASFRSAQHCVSDRGIDYVTLNLLTERFGPFGDLDARVRLQSACTMPEVSLPAVSGDRRDTFGIQLHDFEGDHGLLVGFDMHRDTFDETERRLVPGHFFRLVDAFLEDLSQRIDSVGLLDDVERRALVAETTGRDEGGPPPDLLAPIREQMRLRADEPAIVAGDRTLSYRALERRVDALSQRLRVLGVDREVVVGLYLPRGSDELVSMLAILEAGGAYLPLDPTHPPARNQLVLEDAAPALVLTHAAFVRDLEVPEGTVVLALDDEWPSLLEGDVAPHPSVHDPEQLAYVLFTSGSTGRPKGVEIPRRAFANLLRSMAEHPGMSERDRLLAVTTITFDIAGLELFLPLTVGATVRIADRESSLDPALLRGILEREPITVVQATPTTFRLLIEAGWRGHSALRLLVGGEPLSSELAAALLARCGTLYDVYGPTETTIWSTVKRIEDASRITIGRPIDRTRIYVVDAGRNSVPRGVIGELAIAGAGLARGYRGRPDLTRERFIVLSGVDGPERAYLTGDLARQSTDGDLECLGRTDHQVKVRGFRIELGDIESTLRSVEGVRDVVVLARADLALDPRLVAYYVAESAIDRDRFVERVRASLPAYMHPSVYVRLDAFPLNTNGKVDRRELPAPESQASEPSRREIRRPRDDRELRMATLFRDVLGVDEVGLDDDFFALGGTSPLAIELRRRIETSFVAPIPLRALFESPSPLGLVARLGESAAQSEPIVVTLRQGPEEATPLFCLLGVQLYDELARSLREPRSVYGLHVPIRYSPARDEPPSVAAIADRYLALIRRIRPHGPYALLGLCFGGVVAFEVASRLRRAGETVELVASIDAVLPRGVSYDRLDRVLGLARRAIDERHRIPAFLRSRAERVIERLPPSRLRTELARRVATEASALAIDEVVDMPLAGPLIASQYAGFQASARFLDAPLLVVLATDRTFGDGRRVAPDGGFGGLARTVHAHALAGDHLELLRAPRALDVARLVEGRLAPPSSAPNRGIQTLAAGTAPRVA